jgi:hypothetical protein
MIARADLQHGAYYEGRCRNATVARWDGTREKFRHWRTKFSSTYLEYICHPDDNNWADVFVPAALLPDDEFDIPLEEPNG